MLVAIQNYLKAVNIDLTIDIADSSRFNTARQKGWSGILLHATAGTSRIITDKIGAATDYVSIYRPDWFKAEAASIVIQPDYNQRTIQIKKIVKALADEASIIQIYSGGDLSAQAKIVQGLKWSAGGAPYYYEPANAWLSK